MTLLKTVRVNLTFDGGSRGNPGPAYGSYLLESRAPPWRFHRLNRLEFGRGTNNEAEYWTLLAGVKDVLAQLRVESIPASEVELTIRGDSRLVLQQIRGEWKAKDRRMRQHRAEVLELLEPFGRVRIAHQPRARSVRQLGH